MNDAPATQVTSLHQLRQPTAPEQHMPVVRMGFENLQGFELLQRAAKALASSTLVPAQFQNNLPNTIVALEMSTRLGASPLQVMQNLYVVHGRPGWSAKFLVATFNQCGRFSAIRYEWQGERDKDSWGCKAWAVEKATQLRIEGPLITIALARKEGWYDRAGSKWKSIPELMLMYRSAAWMVNTNAPELSMGLSSAEEIGDVYDTERAGDGSYNVEDLRDLQPAQEPEKPAEPVKPRSRKAAPPPEDRDLTLDIPDQSQMTVIDAIAKLAGFTEYDRLATWVDTLPGEITGDERFGAAFATRQDEIRNG